MYSIAIIWIILFWMSAITLSIMYGPRPKSERLERQRLPPRLSRDKAKTFPTIVLYTVTLWYFLKLWALYGGCVLAVVAVFLGLPFMFPLAIMRDTIVSYAQRMASKFMKKYDTDHATYVILYNECRWRSHCTP